MTALENSEKIKERKAIEPPDDRAPEKIEGRKNIEGLKKSKKDYMEILRKPGFTEKKLLACINMLIPKVIVKGKQDKHIMGTKTYKNVNADEVYPRGYLTIDPDVLLKKHFGKGHPLMPKGAWNSKVRFVHDEIIGVWIDANTGEQALTSVGLMCYGNDGVHIVPARPSEEATK